MTAVDLDKFYAKKIFNQGGTGSDPKKLVIIRIVSIRFVGKFMSNKMIQWLNWSAIEDLHHSEVVKFTTYTCLKRVKNTFQAYLDFSGP